MDDRKVLLCVAWIWDRQRVQAEGTARQVAAEALHKQDRLTPFRSVLVLGLSILVFLIPARAQDKYASSDDGITPERLGLPKGNSRTSEPFVTRIYKTDDSEKILKKQPSGYPFTITGDYVLKENEVARVHEGVDLSSRPEKGKPPKPLAFKAGVHGVVIRAGDGPWGAITVQIADGSLIQYLHTSASHVKVGDVVAPDTKLGVTGRTGAGVIHLHIQAKDSNGSAISPDLAFKAGQRKLESKKKPEKPDPDQIEFDPDAYQPSRRMSSARRSKPRSNPRRNGWSRSSVMEATWTCPSASFPPTRARATVR